MGEEPLAGPRPTEMDDMDLGCGGLRAAPKHIPCQRAVTIRPVPNKHRRVPCLHVSDRRAIIPSGNARRTTISDSASPKKGKRGGGKPGHRPGRGHRRRSEPAAKREFQKKAKTKKAERRKVYNSAVERWRRMSEDARKMCPELDPENFLP